jgi:hypothetical protein
MPASKNIKIKRGDTLTIVFRMKTVEFDGSFQPLDLTGSTLVLKIEDERGGEWVYTSDGPEFVIDDPTSGEVVFTLSEAVTDGLPAPGSRVRWSLKRSIDGTLTTHIVGNVTMIDWVST